MKLFCCTSAKYLGLNGGKISIDKFSDGEICVQLGESVREKDVAVLQTFPDVNEDLVELLLTVDALKRGGAGSISLIIPYFPYSRQDRKHMPGVAISARVVCDLIQAVHPNRVVSLDLHADQIQGFMPNYVQFDHLSTASLIAQELKTTYPDISDFVFASPDAGGVKRARHLARLCGTENICIMSKTRAAANEVEGIRVIGDVDGHKVVIVDDMIDTAGTLVKAVEALEEAGATHVCAAATHGIFSGLASKRIDQIPSVIITDTLPQDKFSDKSNVKVVHINNFIEEVCRRITSKERLTSMFEWTD